MRRIRNIDFCSQELETLLPNRTDKIAGTTLDAFAAVAQEVAENSPLGKCDFCIFSSWIPAIVSGREPDGGHAGSIEEHLLAAVRLNTYCQSSDYGEVDIPAIIVPRPRPRGRSLACTVGNPALRW